MIRFRQESKELPIAYSGAPEKSELPEYENVMKRNAPPYG
jgi:hypothetical protein